MKRFKTLLIIITITISVNSQIRSGISPFRFVPDMYIGANFGPNLFVSEGIGQYFLNGSVGLSESIFLGYNFTQIFGAKIIGSFGSMSWPLQPVSLIDVNNDKKFSIMSMSVEGLLNVSNIFGYYNLNKPVDFVVFGGLGFISREKALYKNEFIGLLFKGGAQFDYRINYKFDINVNFTGNIMADSFNENVVGVNFDAFPELKVGLTYHIRGGNGFR